MTHTVKRPAGSRHAIIVLSVGLPTLLPQSVRGGVADPRRRGRNAVAAGIGPREDCHDRSWRRHEAGLLTVSRRKGPRAP